MRADPTSEHVARLGAYLAKHGNRPGAFFVLRGAVKLATRCALTLSDLPDLPCVMNAADEIESLFEAEGASFRTLKLARELADDAVRELLEESGMSEIRAEMETIADAKFGSPYA